MKKLLLIGAVALGTALPGITAQAAPVAGLATIQTEAAQSGDLQKVGYRNYRNYKYRNYKYRNYKYRNYKYRNYKYRNYRK